MKIEILHSPGNAVAKVQLAPRERLSTESGAMISMNKDINVVTTHQNKGGGVLQGLKRVLAGENFFLNHFTAPAQGGEILLAPSLAGDLMVYPLNNKKKLIAQGSSYLGSSAEVTINMTVQGLKSSLLSGEHLFWLELSGEGPVILSSFGAIYEREINGSYIVDTGHIVAFENTLKFEVQKASKKGLIASFISGEGFVCRFEGQGKLYCQTHNPPSFGWTLCPMLRPRSA